jgi:hypothetical protein
MVVIGCFFFGGGGDFFEWWWNHYVFSVQPFIHHGAVIFIALCVVESFQKFAIWIQFYNAAVIHV